MNASLVASCATAVVIWTLASASGPALLTRFGCGPLTWVAERAIPSER